MEYIEIAAIRMADEEIYTALSHNLCIARANADRKTEQIGPHDQGFVTSTGRYVGRVEAGIIAIHAGQIKRLRYSPSDLYSEELCYTPPEYQGTRRTPE